MAVGQYPEISELVDGQVFNGLLTHNYYQKRSMDTYLPAPRQKLRSANLSNNFRTAAGLAYNESHVRRSKNSA